MQLNREQRRAMEKVQRRNKSCPPPSPDAQWARVRHKLVNPVSEIYLLRRVADDIESLRTRVQIHAFTGESAAEVCNLAGRLVFITAFAAGQNGLGDCDDARILAEVADTLGDLNEDRLSLDARRAAILHGLGAIDRLLELVPTISMAEGALKLDFLLELGTGLGTDDVQRVLAGAAQ